MPKSIWTGHSSPALKSVKFNDEEFFVEEENLQKLEVFFNFANQWKVRFLFFMITWALILPILAISAAQWTVGFALLILSIVLMIFPLPTPQTLRFLGVRKSIIIVRIAALMIAGLGLSILAP